MVFQIVQLFSDLRNNPITIILLFKILKLLIDYSLTQHYDIKLKQTDLFTYKGTARN